jgi:hypothetical protein
VTGSRRQHNSSGTALEASIGVEGLDRADFTKNRSLMSIREPRAESVEHFQNFLARARWPFRTELWRAFVPSLGRCQWSSRTTCGGWSKESLENRFAAKQEIPCFLAIAD